MSGTTWTYRVMRVVMGRGMTHWYGYGIYEVHADKNGNSWTETPVYPVGESIQELRDDLERMLAATRKPVLDAKTGKPVKEAKESKKTRKTVEKASK